MWALVPPCGRPRVRACIWITLFLVSASRNGVLVAVEALPASCLLHCQAAHAGCAGPTLACEADLMACSRACMAGADADAEVDGSGDDGSGAGSLSTASTPSSTSDAPFVRDAITRSPVFDRDTDLGNTASPVRDETTLSPARDGTTQSPVRDDTTQSPVRDETTRSPDRDETTSSPDRDETTRSPVRDETDARPPRHNAPGFSEKGGWWGAGAGPEEVDGAIEAAGGRKRFGQGGGKSRRSELSSCSSFRAETFQIPHLRNGVSVIFFEDPQRPASQRLKYPTGDNHFIVAVTNGKRCASYLDYGPCFSRGGRRNHYICNEWGPSLWPQEHSSWTQLLFLSEDQRDEREAWMRIDWQFETARTLADRFNNATHHGEPVTWTVTLPSRDVETMHSVWRFSSKMGRFPTGASDPRFLSAEYHDAFTAPPAFDETTRSPDRDEATRSPVRDETTLSPSRDETTRSPSRDQTTRSPDRDETTRSPLRDETTRSPVRDEANPSPRGDDTTARPTASTSTEDSTTTATTTTASTATSTATSTSTSSSTDTTTSRTDE